MVVGLDGVGSVEGAPGHDVDGRRARGERSRRRVLERASEVATVEGLGGLSLSQLAEALQLSKSGVHALFGTKEDLQVETVAAARRRFIKVVVAPVWQEPAGLPRLRALTSSWIDYVRRREFPGGCFVARWTSEFASHPGRVRDALVATKREWVELLESELRLAVAGDQVVAGVDPRQLAFELDAYLAAGNAGQLLGDDEALERAGAAVQARLDAVERNSHQKTS